MPTRSSTIHLNEIFNLIDKHGKGKVEVARIGDLLRYSGLNPSEQVCDQIMRKIGKDWITLEDFGLVYDEYQDEKLKFIPIFDDFNQKDQLPLQLKSFEDNNKIHALINAIRTFDHQGTGFISLNELKFSNNKNPIVLTGLGDKLKDEEFGELKQFMEISPNGQVSYEQFITSVSES